jgi:hypothetical protein
VITKSDLDLLFRAINDGSVGLTALWSRPHPNFTCYRADNGWWIRVFAEVGPMGGGELDYIAEVVAPNADRIGYEALAAISPDYPYTSETVGPDIDTTRLDEERWGFPTWLGRTEGFPVDVTPANAPWGERP